MPLVAIALACYAAGLLAGFGGASHPALAAAACAAAAAALRRDSRLAAGAALAAAGTLVALAIVRDDDRCRAAAARADALPLVLHDDARPGVWARARWRGAGCDLAVSLAVEGGAARAGDLVLARGEGAPSPRGIVLREASIAPTGSGAVLVRLRAAAGAAIDRLFGRDAPMARALLVADTRQLDPALRDRYADAGLVHVLSISGLHVAIIAAAAELLLRALRARRESALRASVALTALYVAVIGAPPPAVRAGTMLGVAALCRLRGRATSPWAALAVGAWVPLLLDARAAADLGWQLSVVGMAALTASGLLARRVVDARLDGWRRATAHALLASTVATVATAPIVAWHFGRVSLVAPLTNLAAAPVVAVLQPALFLALVLSPLAPAAALAADGARPLLRALDALAAVGAAVPHGSASVAPTLVAAVLAGVAAAALLAACAMRERGPALVAGGAAVAGIAWAPLLPSGSGRAELHVMDVGQGDAVALRTPRGRWILFDAGRAWRGGDDGRRVVVPYVRRRGGEVAAFVLSHPHTDHAGGAASVLAALRPRAFWDGAYVGDAEPYRAALAEAHRRRIAWRRARPGDSLVVDGVAVRFLAPDSAWMAGLRDANEASVVAVARYGAVRFLLVGDAERGEEEWLLARAPESLRAEVLKVGHHGSRTSTTPGFLDAVRPRLALVSVGAGNSYGHPSPAVLAALVGAGASVLRTDRVGAIVVRTDGRAITVEAEGEAWELAARSATP